MSPETLLYLFLSFSCRNFHFWHHVSWWIQRASVYDLFNMAEWTINNQSQYIKGKTKADREREIWIRKTLLDYFMNTWIFFLYLKVKLAMNKILLISWRFFKYNGQSCLIFLEKKTKFGLWCKFFSCRWSYNLSHFYKKNHDVFAVFVTICRGIELDFFFEIPENTWISNMIIIRTLWHLI